MWRQKEMRSIWWYALRKIRLWTTNLLVFKCTINRACFGRKSAKLFDAELTTSLLIRLLERKGKLVQDGGLVPPSPSSDQVVQRAGGAMCQLVGLVHSPSWVGFCKRLPDGLLQNITRSAFAKIYQMGFCKKSPDELLQKNHQMSFCKKITRWAFAKVYQMGVCKRLPNGLLQKFTKWALAKDYQMGFCKTLPDGLLQKFSRWAFARQSLLHRVGASLWGNQILRNMTEGLPAIFSFRDQQLDHWNAWWLEVIQLLQKRLESEKVQEGLSKMTK